ncbi:hypothetical protein [Granulicella sp. S156]|uniref:hypothetical protein n=1 Tax=Granulicella sp. S156 TaxID=1747224 RepID=UPI00131B90C0|nr:hypothetical protein [Granulicella sp. S156]
MMTAMFSGSTCAQVFFRPYKKDVTVTANWITGEQHSGVTGTAEAVQEPSYRPGRAPTETTSSGL